MTRMELARIERVLLDENTTAAELRRIIRRLVREVALQERLMPLVQRGDEREPEKPHKPRTRGAAGRYEREKR